MLHANILGHEGYTDADLERAREALRILEDMINSARFRQAVLAFDAFQFDVYAPTAEGYARVQRPARTNVEVLTTLLNGKRTEGADSFMDLHLKLEQGHNGHVVGEELNDVITTYSDDFEKLLPGERAGHYLHEWAHALGFHHSQCHDCDPGRNCYSVPYALGNLMVYFSTGRMPFHCSYPFVQA
ncbi:MAG TPA: hypothetical protein VHL57_07065 [Flavobacteriales bacterium]|jgi:hypothetical protein|nr:hypothetical protein [Flavobacteriales bacterium]